MDWFAAALNGVFLCLIGVRALNFWQLNNYAFDGAAKLRETFVAEILYGAVNAVVCYFIYLVSSARGFCYGGYFYMLFCALGAVWFYFANRKKKARTPLKITKRCARFLTAYLILSAAASISLCAAGRQLNWDGVRLDFALIPIAYLLSPAIFVASAWVVYPVEQAVARIYIEGCKKELDAKTDLVKIGVTGSYGKTGVKNILAAMLAERYKVYATPHSYNTPMGICISVKNMPADAQFFIAEMGAKRRGEISLLCDIVKPVCAVITGIAAQHLATFGSLQNIIDTKAELSDFVAGVGGKSYFNTDNDYCKLMYRECKGEKYRTGVGGECFARSVEVSGEGSRFTLCFKNGEEVKCSTRLLGAHNVSNITLAAAVAYGYGITPEEIAAATAKLKPTPHRLELVDNSAGVTIIDDGYNSNEEGARAALRTLAAFDGRKIVACQGLVEMGERAGKANFALGREIAHVADIAVLIGPYADDMRQGALSAGMNGDDVYVKKNLDEAQDLFSVIMRKGDVLLIENDLPDGY